MKRIFKKVIPAVLAISLLGSSVALAEEFTDMPNDWTTTAMENAIKNGLLSGYGDGRVGPNDKITRAQMATIIVRSLGTTQKADISNFTDVKENDWFYDAFAKAVYMKAFNGDGNSLHPNNPITFQECFKVVSCIYGSIANVDPERPKNDLVTQDLSFLDKFEDGNTVAEWAKPYVAALIEDGYWDGIDGKLTPNEHITRAQFAVLMDNLVTTYVTEPGVYKEFPEGNILIKSEDVTFENVVCNDSVIIADGVKETEEGINFKNCTLNGMLVIRGGGKNVRYQGYLKNFAFLQLNSYFDPMNITNLYPNEETGEEGVEGYVIKSSYIIWG